MNDRTIYFHGVHLAKRSTETLIQLINEKIKTITIKTNELFDKDRVETNSLLSLKRQLTKHLFQWNNVKLGDTVVYKEAIGEQMNMFICLTLLLVGFTLAMCGVIVLFSLNVWLGFAITVVGIGAAISATFIEQQT